ncbi:class I SAM-dependent methyltransferase [Streptomyces sp. NPDC048362]|uniref:class I SAM-dependent methyltransferase n=1 Tax=Streptomyces sp. NPDC048362 TaxID=3365539 RepID=UPI00371091D4
MPQEPYILKSENDAHRLEYLAGIYDQYTKQILRATAVCPGWNCLEAGAGTGTIAHWLARTVAPAGSTTATDINPMLSDDTGYTVIRHNLEVDPLPESRYDLVHCRAVLEHLHDPRTALSSLTHAAKPHGWLVVAVHDLSAPAIRCTVRRSDPAAAAVLESFLQASSRAMQSAGASPAYGGILLSEFIANGFPDVTVESRTFRFPGGTQSLYAQSLKQLEDRLTADQLVTRKETQRAYEMFIDETRQFSTPVLVTARARRES